MRSAGGGSRRAGAGLCAGRAGLRFNSCGLKASAAGSSVLGPRPRERLVFTIGPIKSRMSTGERPFLDLLQDRLLSRNVASFPILIY